MLYDSFNNLYSFICNFICLTTFKITFNAMRKQTHKRRQSAAEAKRIHSFVEHLLIGISRGHSVR